MGRWLGIDYGKKRVGIAITDDMKIISSPLDVYLNDKDLLERIKKLCREYGVEKIVLGLPYSDEHDEAEKMVRKFGTRLQRELELSVEYQDETYSSQFASDLLHTTNYKKKDFKQSVNKYAAQKILADFLNTTSR